MPDVPREADPALDSPDMSTPATPTERGFYLTRVQRRILSYIGDAVGHTVRLNDITQYLQDLSKENVEAARVFSTLLAQRHVARIELSELPASGTHLDRALLLQNRRLSANPIFLEVYSGTDTALPARAFLVEELHRADSAQHLFGATEISRDFPRLVARILISPWTPACPVVQQTPKGSTPVPPGDIKPDDAIDVLLRALESITYERERMLDVTGDNTPQARAGTIPPLDTHLSKLLRDVHQNRTQCQEAEVPLHIIRPYDPYHCLEYPGDLVKDYAREIQRGYEFPLLLYEDDREFVCSDDYGPYLAYRLLDREYVPAVIIGPRSSRTRSPGRIGGPELLPAAYMVRSSPPLRETVDTAEVDLYIAYRLQGLRDLEERLGLLPRLERLRYRFGSLIQSPEVSEREVHRFLVHHPELIDPAASRIMSEVALGSDYRVDIALQYDIGRLQKTQLIEVERPNHDLFTKAGRPRAHVTHAIQQVEDWIRWWRENPERVPAPLRPEFPPEGTVLIGRSISVDPDQQNRLEHLNLNRKVKVVTYDTLLERFDKLIRTVLTAGSE